MKLRSIVALLVLVLFAAPALAQRANLFATNSTIAGPGNATIAVGGSERVFSSPGGSDVCVTVLNTGKFPVGISITGASSASVSVDTDDTKAVCSDDTTAVDLTCGEEKQDCVAQWRVDD